MSTTDSMPAPMSGTQASLYQQLRGHLATLKLTDAAPGIEIGRAHV